MKGIYCLLVAFLIGAVSIKAALADPTLVGHWSFDEGSGIIAHDVSGNGNHGSLQHGPTWTTGIIGGALDLDGTDDYVIVPDSPSLDITGQALTFMAWIQSPGFHNFGWIVGKGGTNWYGMVWWLLPRDNGAIRYAVKSGGAAEERLDIPVGLVTDAWQHVAVVYDGSYIRFYLNGVGLDSLLQTGDLDVNNDPIVIGLDGNASSNHYRGKIDEVKVFSRALSPQEIRQELPIQSRCGDVDCSGIVSISDAVFLIQYIFAGGPAPCASCE